jgi:hypothetical protein
LPIKICPLKKSTIPRTADFSQLEDHVASKLPSRSIGLGPTLGRWHVAAGPIALGNNPPIDPGIALALGLRPKNFEMNRLARLGGRLQDRANRLDIATTPTEDSPPIIALDRRTQRQLPATGQEFAVQMELVGAIHQGAQQKPSQFHKVWGIGCLRRLSDLS